MEGNNLTHCAICEYPFHERACSKPEGKGTKGCPTKASKKS
jgi:hypothetical protein